MFCLPFLAGRNGQVYEKLQPGGECQEENSKIERRAFSWEILATTYKPDGRRAASTKHQYAKYSLVGYRGHWKDLY
jgi:hypothetical protein